ncbi:hypothetical protein NXT3_CH00745 [Sinorhizobium fredii]|uniref:Uncharacterized protein n=1 Tax=Rhizobium fredii TaxID=380 RepID=A0A2L0H1J6_RHIFR|nr:hypothetical protein NXT3_CH00745 [Sinorhizobium fredii]
MTQLRFRPQAGRRQQPSVARPGHAEQKASDGVLTTITRAATAAVQGSRELQAFAAPVLMVPAEADSPALWWLPTISNLFLESFIPRRFDRPAPIFRSTNLG